MVSNSDIARQIEELRRELHRVMVSQYDPRKLSDLLPISGEIDRLTLELARRSLPTLSPGSPGPE